MNLFNHLFHKKGDQERIKYVVKGSTEGYNVTFKCSGNCDVVQKPNVEKGWTHTYVANEGDYYYFSAQANSRDASVDLRIYQNGKLFKKVMKSGDYPLVSASGLIH